MASGELCVTLFSMSLRLKWSADNLDSALKVCYSTWYDHPREQSAVSLNPTQGSSFSVSLGKKHCTGCSVVV